MPAGAELTGVGGVPPRPATAETSGFDALASDAAAEGHRFAARPVGDRRGGRNRFDRPSQALLGALRGGVLVVVGGLDAAPCLRDPGTGRLRHVQAAIGLGGNAQAVNRPAKQGEARSAPTTGGAERV